MVKIVLIGALKQHFGRDILEIKIDKPCTLSEFVKLLYEYNPRFKDIVLDNGMPRPGYIVLLNGVDIRVYESPKDLELHAEDEITIIPIVHGGGT